MTDDYTNQEPSVDWSKYRCTGCGQERWFKTEKCIVCGELMERVK